jgi:hypothetical protein
MMDGEHDIETCALVSQRVWSEVTKALHENGVLFEGIIFLKRNLAESYYLSLFLFINIDKEFYSNLI